MKIYINIFKIIISSGKEAVIVYIIINNLAFFSSGCRPQIIIRSSVGTKDASNQM